MRQCICQICICGRHRCEHTARRRVPFAKDDAGLPTTEHKERYRPFGLQPRQQPIVPPSGAKWKGDEPTVKLSTTKKDFVPFPIKKRSLIRPKVHKEPKGKMADHTTYQHDYGPKKGLPMSKVKVAEPSKDGTMPGTLPGKMETSTTYNRCYTPKPYQKQERATAKECTLTEFGRAFTGATETALSYRPHHPQRRETALPNRGTLHPSGDFHDCTTHKTDFPPKYAVPERPQKKIPRWKPGEGKFESDTTHKHDYRCPPTTQKAVACIPKHDIQKFEGPFRGESHYKHDYPPYQVQGRQLPQWHPSFFPYRASSDPFAGETTYRADYEAPPEDGPQYAQKRPLKSNLTLPTGPMEKETTTMRDYSKRDGPIVATRSFKPDLQYRRPTEKFGGRTITSMDYTPKLSEKLQASKKGDNLKPGRGPMEDMSLTMQDFQWLAIECPATYIKMFGKDALPQYEFEKTEGGHDYFKKLRQKKKDAKRNSTANNK